MARITSLQSVHHLIFHSHPSRVIRRLIGGLALLGAILSMGCFLGLFLFEKRFQNRVYPMISVGGVPFGGKTPDDVKAYWLSRNVPYANKQFTFRFENHIATISAESLDVGYDATLSATQAYLVGRSPHILSDTYIKLFRQTINLTPYFRWNEQALDEAIDGLADQIDIPVENALFQFSDGRVVHFKASHNGMKVNKDVAKKRFAEVLIKSQNQGQNLTIALPVDTLIPSITTDQVNSFGIKEHIGRGYSEFQGSIPGRIHNVALAALRINGLLIKPGETFSFVDAVGDISAATGYQSAYIIKEGRTVLGDGGGVCQVSSTLFRAALATGLPILERHAHAYRVHYYEEGGFKPGIDATVFAPSVDLKIKNNTPNYILIQSKADTKNLTLTIDFYGTSDGRHVEIFNHKVWGESPPPPALYQDDPTLSPGVIRQVDFAAWGAKASFQYRVTRNGETLEDTTFTSSFRPWQAVYLRGIQ